MKLFVFCLFLVSNALAAVHVVKRADDLSLESLAAQLTGMAAQLSTLTADYTALKNQVTQQQTSLGMYTIKYNIFDCAKETANEKVKREKVRFCLQYMVLFFHLSLLRKKRLLAMSPLCPHHVQLRGYVI
jgi:hypothetical protein